MPNINIGEHVNQELKIYKAFLQKQGYSNGSIMGYCTYLSKFLLQTGPPQEKAMNETVQTFLDNEKMGHSKTFKTCRAALRLYFTMVTGDSLKQKPEPPSSPEIAFLLERFRTYSANIKRLETGTVNSEVSHVKSSLEHALRKSSNKSAKELTAEHIRDFVEVRLGGLKDSSKGRIVTSIRNFFRCQAFFEEFVHPSVLRLPLSPAVWRKSAFPTTIDKKTFDSMQLLPDANSMVGKRNRCIVLCFTELGLRCSEVASLALDDFNWRGGYMTLRKTKNGTERSLPIPTNLGYAFVDYLKNSRPKTPCRTVFVRFNHLRGEAMGCCQIRSIIRRNGAKAGLDDRFCGTHILRRTLATTLYGSGNSLKVTADILGHESLDSTTHYAKTDVAELSLVAAEWPGGDRDDG